MEPAPVVMLVGKRVLLLIVVEEGRGCTISLKGPSILDEGPFSSVGFGRDNAPPPPRPAPGTVEKIPSLFSTKAQQKTHLTGSFDNLAESGASALFVYHLRPMGLNVLGHRLLISPTATLPS